MTWCAGAWPDEPLEERYPDACEIHGEMAGWFNGHPYCVECDEAPEPAHKPTEALRSSLSAFNWIYHWFAEHAPEGATIPTGAKETQ